MATEVAIKFFTIIFLVFSGNDHSVKVSSNSEVGSGTALLDFFMNKVEDVNYNIDCTYCIGRYFGLDRIGNKSLVVPEIKNTSREYFCCLNARVSEV